MKPTKELLQTRLIQWRAGNSVTKVEKPLRLDRARALGYKAKEGFVVVRVRVARGGRTRSRHTHGRKSRKQHVRKILKMSYQWVAELRAANYFKNLEVLSSYKLAKDGRYYFYEVIMVNPHSPVITSDRVINSICEPTNRRRAHRGLTGAGKKSRGLMNKAPDSKVRPSVRAGHRQGK